MPEAAGDLELKGVIHGPAGERLEEPPPASSMRAPPEPLAEQRRLHSLPHSPTSHVANMAFQGALATTGARQM